MENIIRPDFLFEVSWEVCNKVGGINTVIATKAPHMVEALGDSFIMIGPDLMKDPNGSQVFIESDSAYKQWVRLAHDEGLRFRIGRWNIAGKPLAILVDFTASFASKDEIFKVFWEQYKLDSLYGGWDYVEPFLFGYTAARIIESFYRFHLTAHDKLLAQFHEWMTGAGILYLKANVPQAATAFTTHATVLGRSVAGNNWPLYARMTSYQPEVLASEMNVTSKYSLEKLSAQHADVFTTVSDITAKECSHFLSKPVDMVTPNGFEDSFVPVADEFDAHRNHARAVLKDVASAVLNQPVSDDAIFVINSGRYEFKNKGIDLFIQALGKIQREQTAARDIIAFITVPANHSGVRTDIVNRLNGQIVPEDGPDYLTHHLFNMDSDPIILEFRKNNLFNNPDSRVKVIFVPSYLDGDDGLFNLHYYDLLIGFDVSVFPSYYEPWGYTPMESTAFHIPTITTTLAGFGLWVKQYLPEQQGVRVIDRNDDNDTEVVDAIALALKDCTEKQLDDIHFVRHQAFEVSRITLWQNLKQHYFDAYHLALAKAADRFPLYRTKILPEHRVESDVQKSEPHWRKIMVKPNYPDRLQPLLNLTRNLWWTWNPDAIELFESINPQLFEKSGHNPIALLESLNYQMIQQLENNAEFMARMHTIHDRFESYMAEAPNEDRPTVAYFCMEYGLHASLKLYSGGLGILAGDYLKEASDSNVHMTGIGLLYRYGYFNQGISLFGDQMADYSPQKFSHLPLNPVRDANGEWLKISLGFPGRRVFAKIWRVDVGRVKLYLLDADIEDNSVNDRQITHFLYGGDWENRLKQELLLGIGGIKMLNSIGLKFNVYHCNEGHAAFMNLERLKNLIQDEKLSYAQALEVVRASSLFTTHTPVPAGHDSFTEDMLRGYLSQMPEKMNLSWADLIGLGRMKPEDSGERFSMSVLAMRTSQETNGVSKIHGRVTREMFTGLYKGYFADELYISSITNGVHLPTWSSNEWQMLFCETMGPDYALNADNLETWEKFGSASDDRLWQIRSLHRHRLKEFLSDKISKDLTRRQESPSLIINMLEQLSQDALTIGFARRFATYKRAHLLFKNLDKLKAIVNNPARPVRFVFAGKAHPADKAGQDFIKRIVEVSRTPDFAGKLIFLENYDSEIARLMVSGVDIWLNTPTRPLEASGTSGMKAVMNGVLNLSVLDGWWAEGYIPKAGWALKEARTYENQTFQDELDAETIYNLLEDEIVPLFFNRNNKGLPCEWLQYIRKSFSGIVPQFTMKRMMNEYFDKYYIKLAKRSGEMCKDSFAMARELTTWKRKISRNWEIIETVEINLPDSTRQPLILGEDFYASVTLDIKELKPSDLKLDLVFGQKVNDTVEKPLFFASMKPDSFSDGKAVFSCVIPSSQAGVYDYAIRMRPDHPNLPHAQDLNLIRWV